MDDLSNLFKALSDRTRLRVLNLLLEAGELCVCDLESTLGCTQTKISRHMSYLKRAGLTTDRRSGRWVFYSVARPKTEPRRLALKNLRELLAAEPWAGRDITALERRIAAGCCVSTNQQR
jgi:ArsR family transcriptional regulator